MALSSLFVEGQWYYPQQSVGTFYSFPNNTFLNKIKIKPGQNWGEIDFQALFSESQRALQGPPKEKKKHIIYLFIFQSRKLFQMNEVSSEPSLRGDCPGLLDLWSFFFSHLVIIHFIKIKYVWKGKSK